MVSKQITGGLFWRNLKNNNKLNIMPYQQKTLKDIPNWLDCPLCHSYDTKYKTYLMKHFTKCTDYEGHIDDVEDEMIDDEVSIGNYIEMMENKISLTKHLIKTNELEGIQTQTVNEIINYITNKLGPFYSTRDYDAIDIYQFFFGRCKESDTLQEEKLARWLDF